MTEEDQRKQQFISPSKHKLNPYLVIHFNRTENFGAGGGGGGGGGGNELSSSCSCSWFANYIHFPLDSLDPSNWSLDGVNASIYVGFKRFPADTPTATASGSYSSAFTVTSVQAKSGMQITEGNFEIGDGCYLSCTSPNYESRFFLRRDFTVEFEVYFKGAFLNIPEEILRVGPGNGFVRLYRNTATPSTNRKLVAEIGDDYNGRMYLSTSASISTSQWYHIAICRQSSTWKLVLNNGVAASQEYIPNFEIGSITYGQVLYGVTIGPTIDPSVAAIVASNLKITFRESLY